MQKRITHKLKRHLELELMRELLVGEAELRLEIRGERALVRVRLDGSQQLLVDVNLRLLSLIGHLVFLNN